MANTDQTPNAHCAGLWELHVSWTARLPRYRIQLLDRDGRTSVQPVFECEGDAEAKKRARQLVDALDLELWEGGRLVEMFPRR
jgi:hypothetical protein